MSRVPMDEPAELTDAEQEELRGALERLRGELTELVELSKEGAKPVELDQASVGRVSRMDAIQSQQIAVANRRSHEVRLGQVMAALGKVGKGTYGYCLRCEEPIGTRRLRARPESPLCLQCQGASETRR